MLAKLSIIVTDSGAPPDILGDAGIIYKTGDIFELTKSLEILIEDNDLRKNLGKYSYNYVREKFSKEAVGERLYQFYKAKISTSLSERSERKLVAP